MDYAIAGGVNMILGDDFTQHTAAFDFLSKDQRCKAFDDSANGYVRAEGGGLAPRVNRDLVQNMMLNARLSNQPEWRQAPSVITAPHRLPRKTSFLRPAGMHRSDRWISPMWNVMARAEEEETR